MKNQPLFISIIRYAFAQEKANATLKTNLEINALLLN